MKHALNKSGNELGCFLRYRVKGALGLLVLMIVILFVESTIGVGPLLTLTKIAGVRVLRISRQPYPIEEAFVEVIDRLRKAAEESES